VPKVHQMQWWGLRTGNSKLPVIQTGHLVVGFMSHLTRTRSFWRWVFPGVLLHWYWQWNTKKQNNTCNWKKELALS